MVFQTSCFWILSFSLCSIFSDTNAISPSLLNTNNDEYLGALSTTSSYLGGDSNSYTNKT